MSASADSLDNVSISSFDEEVQEQRAERVRQLYREDRERKAEARAAAAAAKKEQAAEKKAAKAAAKAKAAAQGKEAKGKKTAQERRAAPPVWRRTKGGCGRGQSGLQERRAPRRGVHSRCKVVLGPQWPSGQFPRPPARAGL